MGTCVWHIFPVGQLETFKTDTSKSVSKDPSDAMKIRNKAAKRTENAGYGEGKRIGRKEPFS